MHETVEKSWTRFGRIYLIYGFTVGIYFSFAMAFLDVDDSVIMTFHCTLFRNKIPNTPKM